MLCALVSLIVQQSVGAGEPPAGRRHIPFEQQSERHPEHAPRGAPGIAGSHVSTMCALQHLPALVNIAEEIGGGGKQLKIFRGQGP